MHGSASEIDAQGVYDLIFSIDLLEHIIDDIGTLEGFRQALSPQGRLLLHLPRRHQDQQRVFSAFKNHIISDHVRDEYNGGGDPGEID